MKRIWNRNWTSFARRYRFKSNHENKWARWRYASVALAGAGAFVVHEGFSRNTSLDILARDENARHQVHTDHKLTKRELRFLQFASIEYDDVIYMSPMDFIDSLTLDAPRERVYRRVIKEKELKKMLKNTPAFRSGSKELFRSLDQNGIISYSEYIFLLTLITKSKSAFKIAFLMFDGDDNGKIDKDEFLLIRGLMTSLRSTRGAQTNKSDDSCQLDVSDFHFSVARPFRLSSGSDSYALLFSKSEEDVKKQDTTLLLHLFGQGGNGKLSFNEFRTFYENLQEEIMEIEFHEFARGKSTISPMDFARLVLRYTIVNKDDYHTYINRVKERSSPDDKGVTLGQWASFSLFLNDLEEFSTAVRLYANANMPVSPPEFARAVLTTIGEPLDPYVVSLIYRIFDANNDQTLSYPEFLAVMNDRLHRGLKGRLDKPWGWRPFKNCVVNELSRY
nr:Protein MICU-1, isoform a [Haemonchus contortus]